MAALAELVLQALVRLATILGLAQTITTDVQAIKEAVGIRSEGPTLQDLFTLNSQIYAELVQGPTSLDGMIRAIKTDVNTVKTQTAVNFTTVAPSTTYTLEELMTKAGLLADNLEQNFAAFPTWGNALFIESMPWSSVQGAGAGNWSADPSTILLSDADVSAWLNRVVPLPVGWSGWAPDQDGLAVAIPAAPVESNGIVCTMTPADFAAAKDLLRGRLTPPIWPGTGLVTLGTPVAISDGVTVPGPLDGVLVSITGVPYPVGYYAFGALKSYTRMGAIVFISDNGDLANAIPLGPESQVVSPTAMSRADHAIIRVKTGVTGTITPWVTA